MKLTRVENGFILTIGKKSYVAYDADDMIADMINGAIPLPKDDEKPENHYAEAKALVMQGHLIDAIKIVRRIDDIGLKEAKDLVESWPEYVKRP